MASGVAIPTFHVLPGRVVHDRLAAGRAEVMAAVREAYLAHGAGRSVNPDSLFLRFPGRPDARIIALPAHLDGEDGATGIKWISSFPGNVQHGLPRASGVLILNDLATGYPYVCLDAAPINAARTAASAALAAAALARHRGKKARLGVVGAGVIARAIVDYLLADGWQFDGAMVFDLVPRFAFAFAERLEPRMPIRTCGALSTLLSHSDLIVFATTAATPHVRDEADLKHKPLILHISLRDLHPGIIMNSANYVDDVEHCLKAQTSLHLTEQEVGHRKFIAGTIDQLLRGEAIIPGDHTLIFSPFGMGILDIAVGHYVASHALASGQGIAIPDFTCGGQG